MGATERKVDTRALDSSQAVLHEGTPLEEAAVSEAAVSSACDNARSIEEDQSQGANDDGDLHELRIQDEPSQAANDDRDLHELRIQDEPSASTDSALNKVQADSSTIFNPL